MNKICKYHWVLSTTVDRWPKYNMYLNFFAPVDLCKLHGGLIKDGLYVNVKLHLLAILANGQLWCKAPSGTHKFC